MNQRNEADDQFRKANEWKSPLRNIGLKEWLEIIGILVLVAYTTATFFQLREAQEANRFAQRASIDLGSPNGEIASFSKSGDYIQVYARNTGATIARQTHVEFFPSTVYVGQSERRTIPAFAGWSEAQAITGLSIPPGVAFPTLESYDPKLVDAVKGRQASVTMYGRISFVDHFGRYCQSFCLAYNNAAEQFILSVPVPDLCISKPSTVVNIAER